MSKPKIVIIGSGFGGVYTAKELCHLLGRGATDITIISKNNYFLFTPLLHEVATGSLRPDSIVESDKNIFRKCNASFVKARLDHIDTTKKTVSCISDNGPQSFAYDYLVIATGAETDYYDIPGSRQYAFPLKSIDDAVRIRERIISVVDRDMSERHGKSICNDSFVVVGGGATGVEMAMEIAEFVSEINNNHKERRDRQCPTISIVDSLGRLLEQFPEILGIKATQRLKAKGVSIYLNSKVVSVSADQVTLSHGTTLDASTVIWTAGVKPIIPIFVDFMPQLYGNRLAVDKHFLVRGSKDIFALGDVAGYNMISAGKHSQEKVDLVPMLGQAAVMEAKVVAHNIVASIQGRRLQDFVFKPKGYLVSLGRWFATGQILNISFSGKFAWWMWRTIYLFRFISWRKRFAIAYEWTLHLFDPRRSRR